MYTHNQNKSAYKKANALLAITITISVLAGLTASPLASAQIPTIETIVGAQTISEGVSAKLWVEGVSSTGSIVKATITRPDGQVLIENFMGGVSDGAFEVDYDGFFDPGEYQVSIVARGNQGASVAATTTVTQLATEFQNDTFEPDNTADDASWFGINVGLHAHTFFDATDEDWVFLYAEDFFAVDPIDQKLHLNEVDFETRNLAPGLDTKIEIYKFDPLDPFNSLQLIAENDDREAGDYSSYARIFVHDYTEDYGLLNGSGFYAVRVINMSPTIVGEGSHYDIRIWREQGAILAGGIAGIVTSKSSGLPISKAAVGMPTFGALETITTDDGIFVFPAMTPGLEYTLEASSAGYKRSTPLTVTVRGGEFVEANFALVQELNDPPAITLIGDATITIACGDTFTDPGATAQDALGVDLSGSIDIGGDAVNTAAPSTYTILYNVNDSQGNSAEEVSRIVTVVDTVAPVIDIIDGDMTIECDSTFNDPGATALDACDGALTVVVAGDLVDDTSQQGVFRITYTATDNAGNSTTVTRIVTVNCISAEAPVREIARTLLDNLEDFDDDDNLLSLVEAQIVIPGLSNLQFAEMDSSGDGLLSEEELTVAANPKALGCYAGNVQPDGPVPVGDLSLVALTLAMLLLSRRIHKVKQSAPTR